MWRVKRFWSNLTRVIAWIPVIWRGTDYDYEFLIKVLNFGMERLEHHIRHHGMTVNRNKDADQIKYTRLLGERLTEFDPSGALHRWHKENPNVPPVWKGGGTPEQRKTYDRASRHNLYVEERDWNEYWERLRRYARGWWD